MKVKLHYQINEIDGTKIEGKYIETEFDDPIFLNMQFCIERKQYDELSQLCKEYKYYSIHEVLQQILNEAEPGKIIYLADE